MPGQVDEGNDKRLQPKHGAPGRPTGPSESDVASPAGSSESTGVAATASASVAVCTSTRREPGEREPASAGAVAGCSRSSPAPGRLVGDVATASGPDTRPARQRPCFGLIGVVSVRIWAAGAAASCRSLLRWTRVRRALLSLVGQVHRPCTTWVECRSGCVRVSQSKPQKSPPCTMPTARKGSLGTRDTRTSVAVSTSHGT